MKFLLLLLLFLAFAQPVSAQTGSDWYMAGANPERSSWIDTAASGGMSVLWYRPIEAYIDQKTQVIAVDDRLYLATANGLLVFNANNGSLLWRFDTELPLGHSPTVFRNVVYIGGYDHNLYALNATNGALLWTYAGATGAYHTSPLVITDTSDQPVIYIGNRDFTFYAIGGHGHQRQGQVIWSYQTGSQINFSAAHHNGRLYFASDDNYAYSLNASNGSLIWKTKMPGDGFHSWWPVIYKDKVVFSQTNPYREASVSPGKDDSPKNIGNVLQVFGADAAPGLRLGQHQNPTTWSDGFYVVNAGELSEAYERMPNSTNSYKHLYWMRPFVALYQNTGLEFEYDSDGDGFGEGLPFSWWAKPGSTIYPPVVNNQTGKLYAGALFDCCSDVKGKIYGWTDQFPHLLSMTGSTSLDGAGLPNRGFGFAAMAEPQAISGGGGLIYRSLCCDRVGDSGQVTSTSTDQPGSYWSYSLGGQIPNYDAAWYVSHTAISRHINWYDGLRDYFPQNLKTYTVTLSSSPRAQYTFNPRRNGTFANNESSVTITVTATWDTNGDGNPEHVETIPVTIQKQTGCSANPVVTTISDPNPNDDFDITVNGVSYCYESNSINGQYGNHGDQNPLIPHKGKVISHRSNTLIVYGPGGSGQNAGIVNINQPSSRNFGSSGDDVQNRLQIEVEKIISVYETEGKFLRPAYTTSKLHNYGMLADYFTNPGDTLYSLSLAYPHLSENLKTRVRSYLSAYIREYFGTDAGYDSTAYSRTGWAGLASRDTVEIPPDITYRIPQLTKTTTSESGSSWQYPPHNIYAMYLYVKNVNPAMAGTLYAKARQVLPTSPTTPDEATTFTNNAFEHNAWITGYTGFLNLQVEAGMQSTDANLRQQILGQRDRLLTLRQSMFDKDSPWALQGITYRKTMDLSRNFLHLNPELADYMRQNIPHVMTALDEYQYIAPAWYIAKYESIFGESGSQNLYQIPALFQAKAWIERLPQNELIKYLDAPAFPRGDLYYIQNAAIALSAPIDPNYTPAPTQQPVLIGDFNGDGRVDFSDFLYVLQNFTTMNIFDLNRVISNFGSGN